MPTLFGAHLIGNAVFLGLQELDAALPTLHDYVVSVPMDPELKLAYDRVECLLRQKVKEMARTMLQTLMGYPDHPYGWGDVGYKDKGSFVRVVTPANLDSLIVRPKERKFIDICQQEFSLGRLVWVYVQLNGERNVESRVARLLEAEGLRVKILRQSVPLDALLPDGLDRPLVAGLSFSQTLDREQGPPCRFRDELAADSPFPAAANPRDEEIVLLPAVRSLEENVADDDEL